MFSPCSLYSDFYAHLSPFTALTLPLLLAWAAACSLTNLPAGDGDSDSPPPVDVELRPSLPGTTYYNRPDGGSYAECTGLVDAPYPGAGVDQVLAIAEMARRHAEPVGSQEQQLIWVNTWNCWGETTTIEPTVDLGPKYPAGNYHFDMLEVVLEIFGPMTYACEGP